MDRRKGKGKGSSILAGSFLFWGVDNIHVIIYGIAGVGRKEGSELSDTFPAHSLPVFHCRRGKQGTWALPVAVPDVKRTSPNKKKEYFPSSGFPSSGYSVS